MVSVSLDKKRSPALSLAIRKSVEVRSSLNLVILSPSSSSISKSFGVFFGLRWIEGNNKSKWLIRVCLIMVMIISMHINEGKEYIHCFLI